MAHPGCAMAAMVQQQQKRRVPERAASDLAQDTEFRWKTFGATIRSRVIVFEPPHEPGWDARGVLRACHGWMLEEHRDGCRVVTEECQNGILPALAWWYLRPMLMRRHQNWIESLRRVSEGGDP
jgi:hypothetical protein